MNTCHPRLKSPYHLTKLSAVVIIALTLFPAPAMSQNNVFPLPSGNVGIGTTTPGAKLDISGNSAVSLKITNAQSLGVALDLTSLSGGYAFSMANNAFLRWAAAGGIQQIILGVSIDNSTYLLSAPGYDINLRPEANPALGLTIKATTGNVGIGTTSPTKKLDVNGDINVSGNINAKYQDVAEWVPATETMAPGTVVVLNPEKSNEVMPATRAYDTTVAGVVSTNPGLTLGERSASKAQIATLGRVRVKASATGQPIQIGDLLVTSGKSGLAMKSEPMEIRGRAFHQPGTIIGKALEPLGSGEGEILVLLSLQ